MKIEKEKILDIIPFNYVSPGYYSPRVKKSQPRFIYNFESLKEDFLLDFFILNESKIEPSRLVFNPSFEKLIWDGNQVLEEYKSQTISFILNFLMRQKFNLQENLAQYLTHSDEEIRNMIKQFLEVENSQ